MRNLCRNSTAKLSFVTKRIAKCNFGTKVTEG
jgi:hypothetical protein